MDIIQGIMASKITADLHDSGFGVSRTLKKINVLQTFRLAVRSSKKVPTKKLV